MPWIEIFYPGVSEVAEVSQVKQPRNSKQQKISNENLWKLDEIQNLASATSKMTSWPQWPRKGLSDFFKNYILKSVHQAEENELLLCFLFSFLQIPVFNSVWCTDFENVIFENIHRAPSEVAEAKFWISPNFHRFSLENFRSFEFRGLNSATSTTSETPGVEDLNSWQFWTFRVYPFTLL